MIRIIKKTSNSKNFFFAKVQCCFVIFSVFALNCLAQTKGGKVVNTVEQKPITGNTYAIIFGVSNYPGLPPLKYADKDAELFRDFLETPAGGNTKPENIFYRTNEKAKWADFDVDALGWLNDKIRTSLKEGDRFYIYFSGHGDAMGAKNYFLLPYDCMPNKTASNYLITGHIEMYHVKTMFIDPLVEKKVEVLLIVDACRTNDLPGGQGGQQHFAQSIAEQQDGDIIMLSAGAGQSAIESPKIGNGHGLFTWYLIAGLSGDADKDGDDADNDGKVSFYELAHYVTSHVKKTAKNLFNADQVPVFLSPKPNGNLETMAVVDSGTYNNWKITENMLQQTNGSGNILAVVNNKGGKKEVTGSVADTALIALDNEFIAAIKNGKLVGKNSAEDFYNKMAEKWPGQSITDEAKYSLASEFINFGQEKINLFLSGKGIVHIQRMQNEFNDGKKSATNQNGKKNLPNGAAEQIERMKMLTTAGFDKAADLMEKAVKLLSSDPQLLESIYPKLYFLKAAADDQINNVSKRRQAIILLRNAIKKDSTAAYNYLMLGHVLYNLKNDSCEIYFKKAIKLAPDWAEPESDLANFYSEKKNNKLAILHYTAAVKLDSLDALAYQNIGVLYSNDKKLDSAKKYFLKGLSINPCDRYANSNMGSMYSSFMAKNSKDDPNFKIALKYAKKSMECDSSFTRAYLVVSGLFNKVNLKDSSIYYLNKGILKNPDDASLYRTLGDVYYYGRDTLKAETYYYKALSVDSLDVNNYIWLSSLYEEEAVNNSKLSHDAKNEFDKAVQYSEKATKIDPSSAYPYNSLADVYLDLGLYDKAILNYKKALKIDAAYVDAINNLGNAYYYQKDYDNAILNYQRALRLNPEYTYAYNNLGNVYYYQKDYDKAIINFQKTIEIDSTYLNAFEKLGSIYTNRQAYDKAIFNYKKALKLDSAKAGLYAELGNAYYYLKSYDIAITYHKKAIQLAPSNPYDYDDLGADYDALNKNDEAITYYKKSIGLDSTYALPYANLAYVYQKTKEYGKAITNYNKAISIRPQSVFLYKGLGNLYTTMKAYDKAAFTYKKALKLDSANAELYNALGNIYHDLKLYDTAIIYHKKAVQLAPSTAYNYNDLATDYDALNKNDEAIMYYKKAIEIDSTNVLPYSNLAFVYQRTKEYDRAIASDNKALSLSPQNAFLYNSIGNIYKDLKNYQKQIYYYKKALEIDSTRTNHLQDLAFAYIYSKDYKNGIACLQKILKLYPNNVASYYNLACGWSLANNTGMAIKYLKNALEKGFKDHELLNQDPDIENLRKLAEFNVLMKQYFPDKVK